MKTLCTYTALVFIILNMHSHDICGNERSIGKNSSNDILIREIANQVSKDSITAYIRRLQDFRTRYSYTDSCVKAAEFLYDLLKR